VLAGRIRHSVRMVARRVLIPIKVKVVLRAYNAHLRSNSGRSAEVLWGRSCRMGRWGSAVRLNKKNFGRVLARPCIEGER
jgi:hypothetical protein